MKKWFLKAINLCNMRSFMAMKKYTSDIDLYNIVKNITNRTQEFDYLLCHLMQNMHVKCYIYEQKCNEIAFNEITIENYEKNKKLCSHLCLKNEYHLVFDRCEHSVCYNCYIQINKCPVCNVHMYDYLT